MWSGEGRVVRELSCEAGQQQPVGLGEGTSWGVTLLNSCSTNGQWQVGGRETQNAP